MHNIFWIVVIWCVVDLVFIWLWKRWADQNIAPTPLEEQYEALNKHRKPQNKL
jgi:hypothetical protein